MSHTWISNSCRPIHAAAFLACLLLGMPALAEDAATTDEATEDEGPTSISEAITEGDFSLFFNYRFENVAEDAFDKDATASTLRTVLNYRSLTYKHTSLFLEFENITDIGTSNNYNNKGAGDLWNGVTDRPVIADPEITEVNQAYVRFDLGDVTQLDLGRREIKIDNVRWVGNVGWRQNHQSLDAATLVSNPTDELKLLYAYVGNVNRIFGDNKQMNSHLLNLGYELGFGTLSGYAYILDYNEEVDWGLSTQTFGIRLAGAHETSETTKIRYEAEYANQTDTADNPDKINADYYLLKLGSTLSAWSFDAAYEVLGAGDGRVTMPLATLHAHNGWADKFLSTPAEGLVDVFLSAGWAKNGWGAKVVYHDFSADEGSISFGTEFDLQLTKKLPCGATLGLKGALYGADEHSSDTEKFWFWLAKKF